MKNAIVIVAAAALGVSAGPAAAQSNSNQPTAQERIAQIFGTLFGDRTGATTSIEAQWAAGQTPLTNQRAQFDSRVDGEVRAGTLTQATGTRLKADYAELVQLEARYGADRRFTSSERNELADRYGALTQVLADRGYADDASTIAAVADGRAAFGARVDTAVSQRRLTRNQGRQIKSEYDALARIEAGYLNDGLISADERADLANRLAALDARVGGTSSAAAPLTARARLEAIGRALPSSGLSNTARAQLQVEYEDLSRLEAAYSRFAASADDQAYLDRRLSELETRARVRLGASAY